MGQGRALNGGKVLLAALVVAALVVLGLFGASRVVQPKDNTEAAGMIDAPANGMLGEPRDSIDVLIVGDSEVSAGFSPLDMWDERGFTAYDSSTILQSPAYGYTLIRRAFSCQSPKVVAIETNAMYCEFSISDALMRTAQDVFPVVEYHDRWKSLTWADFTEEPRASWSDELKGYHLIEKTEPADPAQAAGYMAGDRQSPLMASLNLFYISQIVEFCRAQGATPVFVSTPSTLNWNQARHDRVQQLADELGVRYIDLNDGPAKAPIDWQVDTSDKGDHLNNKGAVKASRTFARVLDEAMDLPDHRDDPAFSSWDESYEAYRAAVSF